MPIIGRYILRMVWVWRYLDKDALFITNTAYPRRALAKILGERIGSRSVCVLFPPGEAPAQLEEDLNQHVIEYVLGSKILGMDISRKYYQEILKEGEICPR